jgi:signal transduction histidine kinase
MKSNPTNQPLGTGEHVAAETLSALQEAVCHLQKMDAIGQLTRGIVHDSNNSLQSIVASLELIRKLIAAGRSAETERFIASAMAAAQRASTLNQNLLGLVRRQPPDPKPLLFNELISGMADMLRRSLGHSIKLELALAADLWETCCDRSQAENMVVNLVLNARDAMPGGGTITIQTSNEDGAGEGIDQRASLNPGQYVCIAVADSGAGMSQEVIERAFDASFTTKHASQNMGLGLTMVRRFARQNEGDATIFSEVGRGTTVRLHLPRHLMEQG